MNLAKTLSGIWARYVKHNCLSNKTTWTRADTCCIDSNNIKWIVETKIILIDTQKGSAFISVVSYSEISMMTYIQ